MSNKKSAETSYSRRNKPTVVLSHQIPDVIKGVLASATDEYGWNLLNLDYSNGILPPYVNPQGAILDALPGKDLSEFGDKAVRVGRLPHPKDHLLPAVLPDHAAAGRMAANHLFERGFRELGYIGSYNNAVSERIWEGFRARGDELDCRISHLIISPQPKEIRLEKQAAQERSWILSQPKPFGVCVYSDIRAGRFCGICLLAGLKVPEDVGIVGYGNVVHECETASVPITSIDLNKEMMGREAARVLQEMMKGGDSPTAPIMVPPKGIVQRHSTDVLAVPNPTVAKALRYIWQHFSEPLFADEVARKVAVSRSGLDRLFCRYLSRTVNAEIMRKRLERCAELLRNTDLPVSDITELIGLQNRTYLHKIFKRTYGMSPRQYRLQLN